MLPPPSSSVLLTERGPSPANISISISRSSCFCYCRCRRHHHPASLPPSFPGTCIPLVQSEPVLPAPRDPGGLRGPAAFPTPEGCGRQSRRGGSGGLAAKRLDALFSSSAQPSPTPYGSGCSSLLALLLLLGRPCSCHSPGWARPLDISAETLRILFKLFFTMLVLGCYCCFFLACCWLGPPGC